MTTAGARKYRVTELDRLYTGKPLLTALGPVSFTDDAQIADALDRIAADGPYTRVGLQATRESRRWRLVDNPGSAAILPPCPNPCRNMADVLASMDHVHPEVPVAFWRCGEYLCCYFDHGVADAFVIMRILDALTEHAPRPGVEMSGRKLSRRPITLAFWTGLVSHRRQLASGVADVFRAVTSRTRPAESDDGDRPEVAPETTSVKVNRDELTFVFLSSPPSYGRALRKYRDAMHPGVTTTSLFAFWVCRELVAAGVNLAGEVQFTTDLRRFLPPERTTHSNFIAVVEAPFSPDTTPEQFSAAVKAESASYASLLKLQVLLIAQSMLKMVGRRLGSGDRGSGPATHRTTVTITDATKFPPDFEIHYSDPDRAEWGCFINPDTREHIALLLTAVPGDRIQATARFTGTHLDRGVVEAALTKAFSMDRLRM